MEFVEVMKQKERMCHSEESCRQCPLGISNNGLDLFCSRAFRERPEKAEEIIMKWAEGHPIKTNLDKFNELFPDYPMDISEVLKECGTRCVSYPRCEECNRKKAIDFWEKEYKENQDEN